MAANMLAIIGFSHTESSYKCLLISHLHLWRQLNWIGVWFAILGRVLRISSQTEDGRSVLRFEGRLAGVWVREAEIQWRAARTMSADANLAVDLRDVVSVDETGRLLLSQMLRDGASFVVAGCAMRGLIADLVGRDVSVEK
jgi:hypothetical protein